MTLHPAFWCTQGLLREKAVNTGELLRQYRVLKEKYDLTAAELEAEKDMNTDVATTIKTAKQSVSESAKYVPLPPLLCSLMIPKTNRIVSLAM